MTPFWVNATKHETAGFYHNFGINESTLPLYGNKLEDIVRLLMEIDSVQTTKDDAANFIADYWGWYDNKENKFTMIYSKRFLLEMCFPYGMEAAEEAGQGKAYRLKIIEVKK